MAKIIVVYDPFGSTILPSFKPAGVAVAEITVDEVKDVGELAATLTTALLKQVAKGEGE